MCDWCLRALGSGFRLGPSGGISGREQAKALAVAKEAYVTLIIVYGCVSMV